MLIWCCMPNVSFSGSVLFLAGVLTCCRKNPSLQLAASAAGQITYRALASEPSWSPSSAAVTLSSKMKLKEDMNPLLLQVFRSVVWVYSVLTFIPWYFLSGAGTNLERARRIKARSIRGHPAGPYRAINSQEKLVAWLHPGVDTLDKMFEYAASRFSQRDCLGTREVLSEEDVLQPNGKVFKKVRCTLAHTKHIMYHTVS